MSNLKNTYFNLDSFILDKLLKEQEEIEPIGGETKAPNEFAYFDFKKWAYEFGTKELFRVEKFKASNGIEYTLEEATEMGAGPMFDVLTQIWELWASDNEQFSRIKDENVQEFGKALYNMMKEDGRGFFFKGDEGGAKVGDDAEYLKQRFGVEMNEQEEGPSYDEVWLKDKLGNPVKDVYKFDNNRGHIDIYPDLGNSQYIDRSSQFIRFKLEEGEVHFVHAFGYERGYDMLKSVLPELPPMGDSGFVGMMNVNTDQGTIPVGIDTANKMIDALKGGLDAEAGAQSDFYGSRGPTSGTVDEQEKSAPFKRNKTNPVAKSFKSNYKPKAAMKEEKININKIGFRQVVEEFYMYNKTNNNEKKTPNT